MTISGILTESTIFGPYRLTHKFWSDRVACHYRGIDADGNEVLIRILHAHLADDARHVAAFVQEGEQGQALGPMAEVPVRDTGTVDGQPFWAVDYAAGQRMRSTPAPLAFVPIEPWLPSARQLPHVPHGTKATP